MPTTPTWAELIRKAIDDRLVDVRVSLPARVQAIDVAAQTVDVVPQLKREIAGPPGLADLIEELPMISGVPLACARGGGAMVSLPVKVGDFVTLLFSDASLDLWRTQGAPVAPGDLRTHTLDGAIALPINLYPTSERLRQAHAENVVIGFDDGGAQIHVKPGTSGAPGEIHLGAENATDFVALAQKTYDELGKLRTAFTAHTHGIPALTVVGGGGGATTTGTTGAGPTPAAAASVAAAKTKAV